MFRNREVKRFAAGFILAALAAAGIGFVIHPLAGILEVFSSCVYGTAFSFLPENVISGLRRLQNR